MARISYIENQKKHWKAEVSVTKFGIRKRRNKSFTLKRDAKRWATEMEMQKIKGVNFINADLYLPVYFDLWFKKYKFKKVTEPTKRTYQYTASKLKLYFSETKVRDVSRHNLQLFFNQLGLSKASMLKMLMQIRACLDDAVNEGTIYRNPARRTIRLDYDYNKTKQKQDKIMSIEEYHIVRDYLLNQSFQLWNVNRVVLMIISQTGLRVGEALALRYSDVDCVNKTLAVDESYESRDGVIKEPKTNAGYRVIPITDQLIEKINEWHVIQDKQLKARGISNDDGFVMMEMHGKLPVDVNVNKSFEQLQKKLGLSRRYSTHMLRHTLASNLIKQGVNIEYVSRFLGHSNADITRDYYVGISDEDMDMYNQRVVDMLTDDSRDHDDDRISKLA